MKTMKVRARSARRALRAWRRDGGAMRMQAVALSVALVLSQLLGALTPVFRQPLVSQNSIRSFHTSA